MANENGAIRKKLSRVLLFNFFTYLLNLACMFDSPHGY